MVFPHRFSVVIGLLLVASTIAYPQAPRADSATYSRNLSAHFRVVSDSIQVAMRARQYEQADAMIRRALDTTSRLTGRGRILFGLFLSQQGNLLMMQRRPEAITFLDSALVIYRRFPPDPNQVSILTTLGYTYLRMNQLGDAEKRLLEAESAYDKLPAAYKNSGMIAPVWNALAGLYANLNDEKRSLDYLRKVKDLSGTDDPQYINTAVGRIPMLMSKGRKKEALEELATAKRLIYKYYDERYPMLPIIIMSEAQIKAEEVNSDLNQSEKLYEEAIRLALKQSTNYSLIGNAYGAFASFYQQKKKDYPSAKKNRLLSLNYLRQSGDFDDKSIAMTQNDLASLYMKMRAYDSVAVPLAEAQQLIQKERRQYFGFISEREKETYAEGDDFVFTNTLSFADEILRHRPDAGIQKLSYDAALYRNGLLLDDARQVRNVVRQSGDPLLNELYTKWNALKEQRTTAPPARQQALVAEIEAVEQQMTRRSNAFNTLRANAQTTWQQIETKLLPTEAAIAFVRFPRYSPGEETVLTSDITLYAALVLRRGYTTPRFVPLGTEKQLIQLLKESQTPAELYAGRRGTPRIGNMTYGDSLYRFVWQPISKLLKGVQTVYYSPDGLLHQVAFAAIPIPAASLATPKADLFLASQYTLNQVFSTRQVAQGIRPLRWEPKQSAVVMGGIAYDPTREGGAAPLVDTIRTTESSTLRTYFDRAGLTPFDSLLFTGQEARDVQQLLPNSQPIFGALATEDTLKQLSGRSPVILHLATHGFFIPDSVSDDNTSPSIDPLFRSGLALAGANQLWRGGARAGRDDGILTAYEVASLDLSRTRLVVLSACETALGDVRGPEGVFGLQRSFRLAGAEKLLMSLWSVPDEPTRWLMKTLYTTYTNPKSGLDLRQAFRAAQKLMRTRYKDPAVWGAFVLVE